MKNFNWKDKIDSFDTRRDIIIAGDTEESVLFCVLQFLQIAREAIDNYGYFRVAFSGGNTPTQSLGSSVNLFTQNCLNGQRYYVFGAMREMFCLIIHKAIISMLCNRACLVFPSLLKIYSACQLKISLKKIL